MERNEASNRSPRNAVGGADEGTAGEVQVAEDLGRTSLRNDQTLVWVHALFAQGSGESADGVELDDAGLQPQTGLEPGELRETHGRSGSKNAATGLKRAGGAFFLSLTTVTPVTAPATARPGFSIWEEKPRTVKNTSRPRF